MEKSFVMMKPDAVQRKFVGQILRRFEDKGLTLVAMKMMKISDELAAKHYGIHKDKPFYGELISFITSSPVVATVWEGENAIATIRNLVGATNPQESSPGSIRGDYALSITYNMIHASDGPETALKEIDLFFEKDEILNFEPTINKWLVP